MTRWPELTDKVLEAADHYGVEVRFESGCCDSWDHENDEHECYSFRIDDEQIAYYCDCAGPRFHLDLGAMSYLIQDEEASFEKIVLGFARRSIPHIRLNVIKEGYGKFEAKRIAWEEDEDTSCVEVKMTPFVWKVNKDETCHRGQSGIGRFGRGPAVN